MDSMILTNDLQTNLQMNGWAVTPPIVASSVLDSVLHALMPLIERSPERGGIRGILDVPAVQHLARSAPVRNVAEAALSPGCFAVRGILFDKIPETNWKVVWHQDLTIALQEQRDVAGFGPWTEKSGIPHVQPPDPILQRMVAVRVHLDPCGLENGPVRVLPGSHKYGRLNAEEIDTWRARVSAVDCIAERGSILAFFPLLLHASSSAQSPTHRRVVHVEFAAAELRTLPSGLAWYQTI